MNAFCDYSYYVSTFLNGRTPRISDSEFPYYSLMATKEIMPYLINGTPDTIPDELKCCCCEIAESIYDLSAVAAGKGIASERVGDLSTTYENAESVKKAAKDGIKHAVLSWLSDTGLLFRGAV